MTRQLMQAESTQRIDDEVRGRRVVHLDGSGQPVRIDFADGSAWQIRRNGAGLSLNDESGALLLGFQQDAPGARGESSSRHRVIAQSAGSRTVVETGEGFQRIQDEAGMLRLDVDEDGDPVRVTAPGGGDDLVYRGAGGTRSVAWLHGSDLLRIVDDGVSLRVEVDGVGWTEERTPTGSSWRALGGEPIVELHHDGSGRPARRVWHGVAEETFARDASGRLTRWTRIDPSGRHDETRRFSERGEPIEVARDGVRTRLSSGLGGRISRCAGADPAEFSYDPQGRRVLRANPAGEERYSYDGLGRLISLESAETGDVGFEWDALGRRTSIRTPEGLVHEHRDTAGRLWAVTDASGRRIRQFVWWRGRPLARLDAEGQLDELYLTDESGTLLGAMVRDPDGAWIFEEAMQPPFGAARVPWRPTLFGHIADGSSRLIVFGVRVYDPDTGTFLTPDPWHGALDDPRRLAGVEPGAVRAEAELPVGGELAYALSRWDPLSRPDFDGHAAWINGLLTVILAPTWGFPLTSVSLFLFEPLNLYMEIIGLFGMLFTGGKHPWKQHTLANARWAAASSRQGTAAFALNGFLPRVISGKGIDQDRAVTIGHVIWIGRQNVQMLNRTRVLEIEDLGLPRAPGAPAAPDPTTAPFTDGSVQRSALAVIGTDDARLRIQGTWWSRGPGNRVEDLPAPGGQAYNDVPLPGQVNAPGTAHLTAPLQTALTGSLAVREFVAVVPPGAATTQGALTSGRGFALDVSGTAVLSAGTVVEVSVPGNPAIPSYGHIATVLPPRTVVLDHALPLGRFPATGANPRYAVRDMTPTATTSPGWAAGGAPPVEATLTAPPHDVATGEVWGFTPTTPAAGSRSESISQVADLRMVVELAPPVGAAAAVGTKLSRLAADALVRDATLEADGRLLVKAPPALAPGPGGGGPPPPPVLAAGDLLTVLDAPTGLRHDTVIVEVEAAGADSRIRIDPLVPAGAKVSSVVRLHDTDTDKDAAAITALTGDRATVGPRSTAVFAVDTPVRVVDAAGAAQVRRVAAIGDVTAILVDELSGTGPFTAVRYEGAATTTAATVPPGQFVKWTQGSLPSDFGAWPGEMLAVSPPGAAVRMTWFAFLAGSLPAEAVGDFHPTFTPLDVEADHYWHIDLPLKIDGSTTTWEPDREDDYPRRDTFTMTSTTLQFWRLQASGAERPAPGRAVTPRAGEVQVPEDPSATFALGDALVEHELHHTLQNTYWGPLLGALPVWGLARTIRDIVAVADADSGLWLKDWAKTIHGDDGKIDKPFADLNVFEFFSIGGIMQLAWTFVILGPLLPSAKAREWLLHRMQFSDWNRVFNPVNSLIAKAIPRVDRTVEASRDWKLLLANLITTATDLRSWIPFVGFVPTLLPDGEQNFLEQQASRSSGDLYSTIVSANEGMSWTVTSRCGPDLYADNSDAQRSIRLGAAARLMWYGESPKDRATREAIGNAPTTHTRFTLMSSGSAVSYLPQALFPGPPASAVQIDDPAGTPVPFRTVAAGASATIGLRAAVPEPRAVVRSTGFYLLPASPGQWTITGGGGGPAQTDRAVITVTSDVRLGSDDVVWSPPIPSASAAVPAGTTTIDRFVTEKAALTVTGQDTAAWQATIAPAPGAAGAAPGTVTPRAGGAGWDVAFTTPAPAGLGVPSVDTRLRIWAHVAPDDAGIFDLEPQDLPGAGRSYLTGELWIPVRDVIVRVADLPVLAAATIAAADDLELETVVKLAGPASIVSTGAALQAARVGDVPPRGEKWKIGLKGRRAVADRTDVPVTVSFGDATTGVVERQFTLTVEPNFTLPRKDGAVVFEATPAAALVLTASAHSGGLSVAEQPPAEAKASIAIAGDDVTVTISAAPVAGPVTFDVVVKDGAGHLGMRTVTVHA